MVPHITSNKQVLDEHLFYETGKQAYDNFWFNYQGDDLDVWSSNIIVALFIMLFVVTCGLGYCYKLLKLRTKNTVAKV